MYKIFSYVTHIPHQYDIANALYDCEMTLVDEGWDTRVRPIPSNVKFIRKENIGSMEEYDVALLHMGGETGPGDMSRFEGKIPIILICHGGPEPFMTGSVNETYNPSRIVESCHNHKVVHCCKRELVEWHNHGMNNATWIWHGMKQEDYKQCQYNEKRAVIVNSGGWEWMNNVPLLTELKNRGITWLQKDRSVNSFDEYTSILSEYNVYISGTKYSSFPRSRADAMHTGMCVLTTNNWDEDQFIKNGENGFFIPEAADQIMALIEGLDMETIKQVGQAGQATAQKVFGRDAYRSRWLETIRSVL